MKRIPLLTVLASILGRLTLYDLRNVSAEGRGRMTTDTEEAFSELLAAVTETQARMCEQLADDETTLLEALAWAITEPVVPEPAVPEMPEPGGDA